MGDLRYLGAAEARRLLLAKAVSPVELLEDAYAAARESESRIPASLCGIVGFKAPFGRTPGLPPFSSDTCCADGPMGRSVADVAMPSGRSSSLWSDPSWRPGL